MVPKPLDWEPVPLLSTPEAGWYDEQMSASVYRYKPYVVVVDPC